MISNHISNGKSKQFCSFPKKIEFYIFLRFYVSCGDSHSAYKELITLQLLDSCPSPCILFNKQSKIVIRIISQLLEEALLNSENLVTVSNYCLSGLEWNQRRSQNIIYIQGCLQSCEISEFEYYFAYTLMSLLITSVHYNTQCNRN